MQKIGISGESGSRKITPRRRRDVFHILKPKAGLDIFNARDPENVAPSVKYRGKEVKVPDFIKSIFKKEPGIWEKFSSMSPSHKNQYLFYILDAKQQETRIQRAKKTVDRIRDE